jgi:rhamnosyltransferase
MTNKVIVLLAACNGSRYIDEQIASIMGQIGVDPHIVVSVDNSHDNTKDCVLAAIRCYPGRISLLSGCRPPELSKTNSANNFFYLSATIDLPFNTYWLAFSDQDDIWEACHLFNAIERIVKLNLAGYSSSVIAFWPDGRQHFVKKSGRISRYNHIFEAPGPGCTFVLPRATYFQFQQYLNRNLASAARIHFHDWAIFAYVRSIGGNWFIDPTSSLFYRQHASNVLGVMLTPRTISLRLSMLFGGWYREQCLAIADFVGESGVQHSLLLRRFSQIDRLKLALMVIVHRRRLRDKILLSIAFLVMRQLRFQ